MGAGGRGASVFSFLLLGINRFNVKSLSRDYGIVYSDWKFSAPAWQFRCREPLEVIAHFPLYFFRIDKQHEAGTTIERNLGLVSLVHH